VGKTRVMSYSFPLINNAEADVNSTVGLLCHVDVGNVADVLEVHTASICMGGVSNVGVSVYIL
jgi:hypothetical protein